MHEPCWVAPFCAGIALSKPLWVVDGGAGLHCTAATLSAVDNVTARTNALKGVIWPSRGKCKVCSPCQANPFLSCVLLQLRAAPQGARTRSEDDCCCSEIVQPSFLLILCTV